MDTSKPTAHANDNHAEHKVAVALDRENTALLRPLLTGKFDRAVHDATHAYRAHGGQKDGLKTLMNQYKRRVETIDDGRNNSHIRAQLIDGLGGDIGLADNFIAATLLSETALDLMAVLAQEYMGGVISTERDPAAAARGKLVSEMVTLGGIGPSQATQLVRRYEQSIHEVAKETLGKGI